MVPGMSYAMYDESMRSQAFSNQQRHTMQGPAYPTAPNICVTGGKIEFIQSTGSPVSSEASGACASPCRSPQRPRFPPSSCSNDQIQKPKLGSPIASKYSTSRTPFSFYSSSEFTPSPTPSSSSRRSLRRKERMERRKADLNCHKTASLNPRRGSSQNYSDSLRASKSSTMPCQLEAEQEILKLKEENRSVKQQLAVIQKEYAKLENHAQNLQIVNREAENVAAENDIVKDKLKDYEETVERCNALEYANAQLQTEAQVQRLQYEKCLDKVASQVVQAIIMQKNQQEQCDKLTKEVKCLQKQNANLCSMLAEKANSLSPSHAASKTPFFLAQTVHEMQSHSLPSTLRTSKNKFHKTKRKGRNLCHESESEADNSFSSQQNSESPFSEDSLEVTKSPTDFSQTPPKPKEETGCWYDIIKTLQLGDTLPSINGEGVSQEVTLNVGQSSGSESEEFTHFVLTSEKSEVPSSSHKDDLAHPLVYSQSSNNQELIVNYSLVPEVSTASIMPSTIVPAEKKVQIDGGTEVVTKDEGYSTMSSDVQTESKEPLLLAIPTLFEEKGKFLESGEQEDIEEVCEVADSTPRQSSSDKSGEFVDGLRVVYDMDDNDSDVFVVALADKHPDHGCSLQSKSDSSGLNRSFSESCIDNSEKMDSRKAQKTMPYSSVREQNKVTLQLDSVHSPLKKRKARRERRSDQDSSENDAQMKAKNSSPSYSHAEMEDWSLDLSGEDLTDANLDPSSYGSTHDNTSTDPPNENIELEEDNNECLWNGASYFKADNDFDWQYEKNKSWDVKLRQCNPRSMNSPKSGCSDQPAMWSSNEQLSCCSDIASKCSTDIENFCEQLCNLPELKHISESCTDNVQDTNLAKLPDLEADSEDVAVDTVFTRDFYRLVKFESTKSLAASSKSLAASEAAGRMDATETGLASVLGFIAEQQKYCRQREQLDETSLTLPTNLRTANTSLCAKNNALNSLSSRQEASLRNNNIMRNQTSVSNSAYQSQSDEPPKPTRSTSLNLGYRKFDSLVNTKCEPIPPSRSSSRVTLPRHSYHSYTSENPGMIPLIESSSDVSDCEPIPPIPPHRSGVPPAPQRISSLHRVFNGCDSPPVPKRVTSRALPLVPPNANPVHTPPRSTSLAQKRTDKRPKSLLREDTGKAPSPAKDRTSCGELSPMCRSSAALLIQLQKMAQEEEDSKDVYVSPVDATPSEESALGTGWIRVQPPDMQNPETRANLLDSMMPSSDTTSTETEEDASSKSQHVQLLKAAQRNRRKKKVSRHSTDIRRPSPSRKHTNIGASDEQDALKSFSFLDSLPSEDSPRGTRRKHSFNRLRRSAAGSKDLGDLRSSEPCDDSENPYPRLRSQQLTPKSSSNSNQNVRPGSIHGKISLFQKAPEKDSRISKPKIPTTSIVGKIRESFERPSSVHLEDTSLGKQSVGLERCNVRAVIEQFNQKPQNQTCPATKSSGKTNKTTSNLPPKPDSPMKNRFLKSSKKFFNRKSGKATPGKLSLSDSCAETFSPLVSDEEVFIQ